MSGPRIEPDYRERAPPTRLHVTFPRIPGSPEREAARMLDCSDLRYRVRRSSEALFVTRHGRSVLRRPTWIGRWPWRKLDAWAFVKLGQPRINRPLFQHDARPINELARCRERS